MGFSLLKKADLDRALLLNEVALEDQRPRGAWCGRWLWPDSESILSGNSHGRRRGIPLDMGSAKYILYRRMEVVKKTKRIPQVRG
jgi:hypothetical protein